VQKRIGAAHDAHCGGGRSMGTRLFGVPTVVERAGASLVAGVRKDAMSLRHCSKSTRMVWLTWYGGKCSCWYAIAANCWAPSDGADV
jgi:hypothetical protein